MFSEIKTIYFGQTSPTFWRWSFKPKVDPKAPQPCAVVWRAGGQREWRWRCFVLNYVNGIKSRKKLKLLRISTFKHVFGNLPFNDLKLSKRHENRVVSFRRWLVALGFNQDVNSCQTPTSPPLQIFSFCSSCCVVQNCRRRLYNSGSQRLRSSLHRLWMVKQLWPNLMFWRAGSENGHRPSLTFFSLSSLIVLVLRHIYYMRRRRRPCFQQQRSRCFQLLLGLKPELWCDKFRRVLRSFLRSPGKWKSRPK